MICTVAVLNMLPITTVSQYASLSVPLLQVSPLLICDNVEIILASLIDTVDERDALIECVYPELQEYCLQRYNIQFQVYYYIVLTDIINNLDLF